MPNGQQERPEPEEIDPKTELKRAKINLHNSRFQVQVQEAIVKKLEELAKWSYSFASSTANDASREFGLPPFTLLT